MLSSILAKKIRLKKFNYDENEKKIKNSDKGNLCLNYQIFDLIFFYDLKQQKKLHSVGIHAIFFINVRTLNFSVIFFIEKILNVAR